MKDGYSVVILKFEIIQKIVKIYLDFFTGSNTKDFDFGNFVNVLD